MQAQPSTSAQPVKPVVRVAAVSCIPPFPDPRAGGINLNALRDMTARVARERPDFICYPEKCVCIGGDRDKAIVCALDLEPYAIEIGKIAREVDAALIAPFLEKSNGRVYNSVPVAGCGP